MMKFKNGSMIPIQTWEEYSEKIPLVAVIGLMNEWMTIYACLQQAIKNFDYIIICGDGVSEKAQNMVNKFINDHETEKYRIQFIEMDKIDPWPWVAMARPNIEYNDIKDIPVKSWSKAGFKRFNYARAMFPNALLCSLHSDVIVFDDTGLRIRERMSKIQDPFFDSEWFSMITMNDKNHIHSILSEDSGPGNHNKHPALKQRTTYDYPGDWGLMSIYSSSLLSVGPDPLGHEAECLYPWNKVTQCEKKGCDTSVPHAIHLEWIRDTCKNKDFSNVSWKILKRSDIEHSDPDLGKYLHVIDNLYFPVKFNINENNILVINE